MKFLRFCPSPPKATLLKTCEENTDFLSKLFTVARGGGAHKLEFSVYKRGYTVITAYPLFCRPQAANRGETIADFFRPFKFQKFRSKNKDEQKIKKQQNEQNDAHRQQHSPYCRPIGFPLFPESRFSPRLRRGRRRFFLADPRHLRHIADRRIVVVIDDFFLFLLLFLFRH